MRCGSSIVTPHHRHERGDGRDHRTQGNRGLVDEFIHVHIIPHSHCDVGWLEPVQEYYDTEVVKILNNIVDQLSTDTSKRFIWAETAFLKMHWDNPNTTQDWRDSFLSLLRTKQIEIVLGGVVMNDEAIVHLESCVDQMTDGHTWISEHLGDDVLPTIGWHIDTFGSSSVTPTLWSWCNFRAFYINRIPIETQESFFSSQGLEFYWQGSPSLKEQTSIWTHDLDHYFCSPPNCNWEWGDPPVTSDNINSIASSLSDECHSRMSLFQGNQLLVPFGCDFEFQNTVNFDNMDILMAYINENSERFRMDMRYSTLSEVTDGILSQVLTYPTWTDDFFSYDDSPGRYWTGFFTTWPNLKSYVRSRMSYLRTADLLYTLSKERSEWQTVTFDPFTEICTLRDALDITQHHDSITGTSPPDTNKDYMDKLHTGTQAVVPVIETGLSILLKKTYSSPLVDLSFDPSVLYYSLGKNLTTAVVITNTLGWGRSELVGGFPVPSAQIEVIDGEENSVEMDVLSTAKQSQLFFKVDIPPVGSKVYFVRPATEAPYMDSPKASLQIENEYFLITFSETSGRISSIYNKKEKTTFSVDQNMMSYTAMYLTDSYIFNTTEPAVPITNNPIKLDIQVGTNMQRASQVFSDYAKQEILLYNGEPTIEFIITAGPIPMNVELITRFTTEMQTSGGITTDEYGMEMHPRVYDSTKGIGGNVFPMVTSAYITDSSKELALVSEHSHGVSSQFDGTLEVFLVRRCNTPTITGISPDDTTVTTHHLWAIIGSNDFVESQRPAVAISKNNNMTKLFASINSVSDWNSQNLNSLSGVAQDLPPQVHLLSMKRKGPQHSETIVRLQHIYEANAPSPYNQAVSVDLGSFFGSQMGNCTETSLTTTTDTGYVSSVTLNPVEIHTLLCDR
ncbi:lysosomal alpha-mannosidase [Pelomyxa schiedti]|nr:lysosomal alpha-mannosidase [Pelomyxa schiedti]